MWASALLFLQQNWMFPARVYSLILKFKAPPRHLTSWLAILCKLEDSHRRRIQDSGLSPLLTVSRLTTISLLMEALKWTVQSTLTAQLISIVYLLLRYFTPSLVRQAHHHSPLLLTRIRACSEERSTL